ncbi:FAD dependent oxidoreductase [Aspergillus minisclerotigenes]|uniref:FAD dependent oxidoreductase n=1 Tax=Aspergillus minisclerotigenes TaxID=656917 RepID=A0A5N6J0E2_9EURO|nr:FAD dependent oxidoreductase [Aspergillus minisclerotigenes]
MVSKSTPIAIVGGGAFGLSTALHLVRDGYNNISVFEQDDQIPPRPSAANDLNKIVRAEYEDPFYTDLTMQAIALWKTPLFAPHFHQTGFLHCVSGKAPERAVDTLKRFQAAADDHPELRKHVVPLAKDEEIRQRFWQYDGQFPGWNGYLNTFDGYAHSGNALKAVYQATQKAGVRFFLGEQHGAVAEVTYKNGRSTGLRTKNGQFHPAELVIVAAGAAAAKLVPAIGSQVVAKSWSVAHVHLTEEETSALRGIPITYARDLGFFFEPDPVTQLLKLCPMGGGYVNTDPATGVSHAPSVADSAFVPPDDEAKIRQLLAHTLPTLANRPLVRKSLCWFADTSDSDFIIDYVPHTSNSVILLSGDSGHGFKMFPLFGRWVKALLEAADQKQPVPRWRWKEPQQSGDGKWGDTVSWRIGSTREFKDIQPGKPKL